MDRKAVRTYGTTVNRLLSAWASKKWDPVKVEAAVANEAALRGTVGEWLGTEPAVQTLSPTLRLESFERAAGQLLRANQRDALDKLFELEALIFPGFEGITRALLTADEGRRDEASEALEQIAEEKGRSFTARIKAANGIRQVGNTPGFVRVALGLVIELFDRGRLNAAGQLGEEVLQTIHNHAWKQSGEWMAPRRRDWAEDDTLSFPF